MRWLRWLWVPWLSLAMTAGAGAAELDLTCTITFPTGAAGPDPVVAITVDLGARWAVVHHTLSGKAYARRDQYFIKSAFAKPGLFVWKGMDFRRPSLTMTGIASRGKDGVWTYREFTFDARRGRVFTSRMESRCVSAGPAADRPPPRQAAIGPALATWSAKEGARSVDVDGISLSFTTVGASGPYAYPQVTLRGIGVPTQVIALKHADASFGVNYGVLRLDPAHSSKDVLISGYTGGAHCCSVTKVASLIAGAWKIVDVPETDGMALDHAPLDLNHDGTPDFRFIDDAFLYMFTDYADSVAPSRFYRINDGAMVDESGDAAFRPLYHEEMLRFMPSCRAGHHGGCAAYVAAAARAGEFDGAWRFMLAHFNRTSTWDILDCAPLEAGCTATTRDFVGALARFLRTQGYIH
ncbi:MAG: hypothetical protein KGQ37_12770 [Hyphomicrobiales bacterium]|nr:hypothetical protein [Hyphomicrobiales bacterium]